jgi:hypothetical protein
VNCGNIKHLSSSSASLIIVENTLLSSSILMATCVRKVYDNDKKYYTLARGPLDVEALGFSLPSI